MNGKPWYTSKIVWLNAITCLAAIFAAPQVTGLFGQHGLQVVSALQASLTIVLRVWFTDQPIGGGQ